jgi:hypothetical protein
MFATPKTAPDSAAALSPAVRPGAAWRVTRVVALSDYRLGVSFVDGAEGIVDMSRLVHSDGAGVFAALSDPQLFAQAHVEFGAVTWPGDIDLAPDAMHDAIVQDGVWVLA